MDVLLLHPPAVKPIEAPIGPAILLGHLRAEGLSAEVIDANLEAYLWLLAPDRLAVAAGESATTAVRRAVEHAAAALDQVRSPSTLASFDRHATATRYLNDALAAHRGDTGEEKLTLGDYRHAGLSEFSPDDLARLVQGEVSTLFGAYFREALLPRVLAARPRTIGLSINYRHQVLPAFELAGLLRRALPGVRLVAGGGMISSWAPTLRELDLSLPGLDELVFGPGEAALAALVREAGEADAAEAQGSAGAHVAPEATREAAVPRWREDGGTLAFRPDFDGAPVRAYLTPYPVLPVTASRGCYWRRCLFCPESAAPTTPFRCGAPDELAALLPELSRRHDVRHFHFTDDAIPVKSLRALAARADALQGLSWYGFVRFERALRDPGLIAGLARSGCSMLQLGLESGSQRVLDRLGKGTRLEDASVILRNLEAAGITSYVYVMLGTPGETEEDALATLRFLEDHASAIGYLNIAIMNLPRGAQLLEEPERHGIRRTTLLDDEKPLGLYRGFEATTGWGRAEARRFVQRRLMGSKAIKEIVRRNPPLFAVNHAVFFGAASRPRAA